MKRQLATPARVTDLRRASFFWISRDFFTLKPSAYATAAYCALLFYATRERTCERISTRTLAERAGMSERKYQLAIKELEKSGAIRVRHRTQKSKSGNRCQLPNTYEILEINPADSPLL